MKFFRQMKSQPLFGGKKAFLHALAGVALTIAAVTLPVSIASAVTVSVVASTGQTLSVSDSGTTGTLLGCTASCTISNLVIPSSDGTNPITILGNNVSALSGMSSITSITIPSSVTTFAAEAFNNVGPLSSVTIPSSVTSIGDGVFSNDTGLTTVTIQNATTGPLEFYGDSQLTSVSIGNTVTAINLETFDRDTALTSVTIPSSVTSIGQQAFLGDTSLTSVYFLGNYPTLPVPPTPAGNMPFYGDPSTGHFYLHTGATGWNSTNETYLLPLTLGTVTDAYSYNTNGGSTAPASGSGNDGSTITLASSPTQSGYTFGGWNDGTTTYAAGASYTLSSNGSAIVFTAQWTAITDAYSYNTNGGSTAPASGSGNDGSTITLASSPTQSGYTFGGWNDGTTTYAAGASYTLSSNGSAIVFTAQWTVATPVYAMDYFSYSDPSVGVVPQNGIGIDNTPITLAVAPVRSGYSFAGWNDGTKTYAAGAKYVLSSNGNPILFTAVWTSSTKPTPPAAPTITSFVGTKHGLVTTFSPTDKLATSFLCRISNGHNVFIRASTMNQSSSQTSYVCAFGTLYAPRRYRVWVTALNQYGSSPFASTTAVTRH
jgi:hypothetical protein